MHFSMYHPQAELARTVHSFWVLEQERSYLSEKKERIFPDGYVDIFFHFGAPVQRYNHKNQSIGGHIQLGIAGLFEQHILLKPGGNIKMIGARLLPGALTDLFGLEPHLTTNRIINLSRVSDRGFAFELRLKKAQNNRERLNIFSSFLHTLSEKQFREKPEVITDLLQHMYSNKGIVDLTLFASNNDVNLRTLQRQFSQHIGIPPKKFARIIRFRNILGSIQRQQNPTFTHLAHEYGYFDQAHFVNDFKKITGLSPRSFFKEHHPISNTLNGLS
ncbi:MAG: AraC family transcriptional regulator [Calditrichia bacterium]